MGGLVLIVWYYSWAGVLVVYKIMRAWQEVIPLLGIISCLQASALNPSVTVLMDYAMEVKDENNPFLPDLPFCHGILT